MKKLCLAAFVLLTLAACGGNNAVSPKPAAANNAPAANAAGAANQSTTEGPIQGPQVKAVVYEVGVDGMT